MRAPFPVGASMECDTWDIKVRKLATAAAVSLVLASSGARALGLGDIEMRSALNQPMNAEIRLTSVQPGEADGMIVKLASSEAFQRAGIERSSALTDLRFAVDQSGGAPVIRISSRKPVVEPFLNFLLEVDWPSGRMVREYTVLLDPPVFMTPSSSSRSSASEAPAILQRTDTSLVTPTPIERSDIATSSDGFEVELVGSVVEVADNAALPSGGEEVSLSDISVGQVESTGSVVSLDGLGSDAGEVVVLSDLAAPNTESFEVLEPGASEFEFNVEIVGSTSEVSDSYVAEGQSISVTEVGGSEIVSLDDLGSEVSLDGLSSGGEVTVQRGDTLLGIARANAVDGVSSQQMMMALLNANKNSFINGNINLVKAGAILRIPDASELDQLSQAQAVAQISEQNQLWREYRDNIRSSSGTRVAARPADPKPEQTASADDASKTELSEAAQRILDAAKDEALNRKELNIVAESDSTTTAASATADNTEASSDAQLGEINKKLQLAKEELASTRLESTDLSEQSAELQSTTENMESLVNIRQQEVARLQEQLRQASSQSDSDAAGAADQLTANAQNAADAVGSAASDATGSVADAGQNALTAAGQQLGEVELVDDSQNVAATTQAVETAIEPQSKPVPWYMELIEKYGKWLVIGIGAISALLAGLLLLGKRRRKDEDMLDYGDDVEFFDDDDGVEIHAEHDVETESSGIGSAVAAGAAGAAAVGGAAAAVNANADDEAEDVIHMAQADSADQVNVQDSLDPDDTISEVDVYLAYGLHGQAEELLAKAIERDPNNSEYALKMLQTQHAQGHAEAFASSAEQYYERFGGEGSPEWASVCEMGYDLQPNNILFASSDNAVESVGKGDFDAPKLNDSDFASSDEQITGSVTRDFGDEANEASETDLMDQSLDPAFAFDETDLEATGDFSQIANEIAEEEVSVGADALDDNSLDFPGFDAGESVTDKLGDAADAGKDKLSDAGSAVKGGLGAVAAGGAALAGGLGAKAASAKDSATDAFDDALSFDDLESAANDGLQDVDTASGSVAEDLTLDLDQLSGDLELDSTELLDEPTEAVDELEIPDLTGDNGLAAGGVAGIEGSDEMDTMMDLAKAYIDMGDKDSASSALGEIVKSGNPAQVSEAETLLRKIS